MTLDRARHALKQYFGYDHFRPLQADIIQTALDQQDALVLMPTGGGKSICYQVPALVQEGLCVVVSPLIALMKDQVEGLRQNGVPAAFVNSSQGASEQAAVMDEALRGDLKLLYVSPERLCTGDFFQFLRRATINLFAIDEAHCISAWGHDFRPEYTQLKFLKQQFPHVPVMALTATADRLTRDDIARQLDMPEATSFIASFDRPNLSLNVRPGQQRFRQILDFIRLRPKQSGIIYCLSRKTTEQVSAKLNARGITAAYYHAGMNPDEREAMQEAFTKDEIPIICATIAFGMGIDKSNIRWVIHYNLPKNIENYYQEIGRAGRDGLKSDTLLFYTFADVSLHQRFLQESGQRELKLAKLERMQQYADARICRRKILLNYFGEPLDEDCGNCDVCNNPPEQFDGTVFAQKALSAIARLREGVGMRMLIDVLRGSSRKEIVENGYDQIRTYGAGRDLSSMDWQQCLMQLLNLGLIEIAYDRGNALTLTPASREVLFNGRKVPMVRFVNRAAQAGKQREAFKPQSKSERFVEGLFEHLRQLRLRLADKEGVAPYQVFADASLKEMVAQLPTNEQQMRAIGGVGERKWQQYGQPFIDAILEYIYAESQRPDGYLPKGGTYLVTYHLYRIGWTAADIAEERQLHLDTVYSHLARLFKDGHSDVDLLEYLPGDEAERIAEALRHTRSLSNAKAAFDRLNGEVSYAHIRLYMAYASVKGVPSR